MILDTNKAESHMSYITKYFIKNKGAAPGYNIQVCTKFNALGLYAFKRWNWLQSKDLVKVRILVKVTLDISGVPQLTSRKYSG